MEALQFTLSGKDAFFKKRKLFIFHDFLLRVTFHWDHINKTNILIIRRRSIERYAVFGFLCPDYS